MHSLVEWKEEEAVRIASSNIHDTFMDAVEMHNMLSSCSDRFTLKGCHCLPKIGKHPQALAHGKHFIWCSFSEIPIRGKKKLCKFPWIGLRFSAKKTDAAVV